MIGICNFCGKNKELTQHEIIAKSYGGSRDDPDNTILNICRDCHNQLEQNINKSRASTGAGRDTPQLQIFPIGSTTAQLQTGSILLDENGLGYIDAGSPIYGMRSHNKISGEKFIEASLSGGRVILITASPSNSWIIYSVAKG